MGKILIIPDVHCRSFFKEPVKKYIDKVDKIIFLGDYLDPYDFEDGVTRKRKIKNLVQILTLKDENPDKVILLLGNHDLHYCDYKYGNDIIPCSRYDKITERKNLTEKLYTAGDKKGNFQLAYEIDNILFSHAGIMKDWLDDYCKCTLDEFLEDNSKAYGNLWIVSFMRGGYGDFGSCVWNDVREFKNQFDDIFQVFGHTQLRGNDPTIDEKNRFACLDCRQAFLMDTETNKIEKAI